MQRKYNTLLKRIGWAGIFSSFAVSGAQAAGSVEYEIRADKDTMKASMEWLDANRVRMDMNAPGMPANVKAWSLLQGGKMYSVSIVEGQTMVMEMGGMMKMLGSVLGSQAGNTGNAGDVGIGDVAKIQSLQATGRRETHAGMSGEVYTMDYESSNGKRQQTDLVLSSDSTAREMTGILLAYSTATMKALGQATDKPASRQLEAEIKQRQLGILRFGNTFKVTRIASQTPAAQRFVLPAAPMAMPQMPNMGGKAPAR